MQIIFKNPYVNNTVCFLFNVSVIVFLLGIKAEKKTIPRGSQLHNICIGKRKEDINIRMQLVIIAGW